MIIWAFMVHSWINIPWRLNGQLMYSDTEQKVLVSKMLSWGKNTNEASINRPWPRLTSFVRENTFREYPPSSSGRALFKRAEEKWVQKTNLALYCSRVLISTVSVRTFSFPIPRGAFLQLVKWGYDGQFATTAFSSSHKGKQFVVITNHCTFSSPSHKWNLFLYGEENAITFQIHLSSRKIRLGHNLVPHQGESASVAV